MTLKRNASEDFVAVNELKFIQAGYVYREGLRAH